MHAVYKKRVNAVLSITLSMAVLLGSLFITSERTYADDFVEEIKGEYQALYKEFSNLYEEDKTQVSKEYNWLLNILTGEQDKMAQIVDADLKYLTELFKEDLNQLESKYGKQREYREKLNEYSRQMNPNYSSSAMWTYNITINRNYSSSTHWIFNKEINPNYSSSTMWSYKNATNPNYSSGTMWAYTNAFNPNYSSSLMWGLRNESNANYSSSTMWSYRLGYLTLAEAREKMDSALAKGTKNLQEARDNYMSSITKTRKNSVVTLFELRDKTADKFLKTRKETVETIQAIREKHFGSRLKVESIAIKFDPIKVLINNNLISFEQPPVIKNGNTLVPMRAIFEQLGATIKWNQEEYSVTATKGDQTIYLKIGDKKAQLNGKTIELDVPAQIVKANTMVPVRFISESLGALVEWDDMTRTVVISKE
ncbi:copper amine oxidase N-terminal domain-containing protein [Paenibacillus sp. GXUN7292]|uniref:copper amine oxidase N-terminal domain-containing protein n=1 Tax=Paenibacillus sp. GXUN7292 TaxID=3422499 RepID=UPI003D7C68AF